MPRISAKKQLEMEQQKKREELTIRNNTVICSNIIMQILELETDRTGFLRYFNEDNGEVTEFVFDGKKCKDVNAPIDIRCEMPFDPYNNVKLACGLVQFYVYEYLVKDTLMIYLTNKNTNEEGQAVVKLDNGEVFSGAIYYKDSLKYLDLVMRMAHAAPPFIAKLKGLDMCVPFKR